MDGYRLRLFRVLEIKIDRDSDLSLLQVHLAYFVGRGRGGLMILEDLFAVDLEGDYVTLRLDLLLGLDKNAREPRRPQGEPLLLLGV